jgi:hypothetical protein
LIDYVYENKFDLVAITETWFVTLMMRLELSSALMVTSS